MCSDYRFRDRSPKSSLDIQNAVLFLRVIGSILTRYENDETYVPEPDDFMAINTLILLLTDTMTAAERLERLMRNREKM